MARVRVVTVQSVTLSLIIINCIAFLLQAIPGLQEAFLLNSAVVWDQPWRILTSMFLHGSFGHLLFNMYALMIFGPLIERSVGRDYFLKLYFGAGLLAALSFIFVEPTGLALGASGAIMGILGAVIMLFPNMQVLFFFVIPMSMRTAGIIFALIDIFGVFGVGGAGVANIAHLGGLAAGLIFGYWFMKKRKNWQQAFSQGRANRSSGPNGTNGGASFGGGATFNARYAGAKNYQEKKSTYKNDKTIDLDETAIDNYFKYGRV